MLSKIEKIFKNRLGNKKSLEGVDTDDLWGAISGNIESVPTAPVVLWKKAWVLILFLTVSLGSTYLYYSGSQYNSEEKVTANLPQTIAENQTHPTSNYTENQAESIQDCLERTATLNPIEDIKPINQNINTQTTRISSIKNKASEFKKPIKNNNRVEEKQTTFVTNETPIKINLEERHTNTERFTDNAEIATTQNMDVEIQKTDNVVKEEEIEKVGHFVLPLGTLLPQGLIVPSKDLKVSIPPVLSLADKKKKKSSHPTLEFGFYSGVNTLAVKLKHAEGQNEFVTNLGAAISNNTGTTMGFNAAYLLNEHFSISSGLEYEITQTTFDFTTTKYLPVWKADHLVSFELDPTSGDTINAQKGAFIDAEVKRHVLHHNKFTSVSIPLEFGLRKDFGRLVLGMNIGLSYNFFLSQKGRTIDSNSEFYDFDDKNESAMPFKKSFFAFQLNPFVDLKVNRKFTIRVNPVLKYQAHGQSSLYQTNQSSILTGVKLGLVMKI